MPERRWGGERLLDWGRSRQQRKGLRPRDAAFLITIVWLVSIILFGALERIVDPQSFHSVWLGMWWALQTVTTVGYGDVVPASSAGRAIASLLLLGGLAFLTVIIAMITGGFVSRYQRQAIEEGQDPYMNAQREMTQELRELRAEVQSLRREGGR